MQLMHIEMKPNIPCLPIHKSLPQTGKSISQNKPVHVEEYFENYDSWLDISAYPVWECTYGISGCNEPRRDKCNWHWNESLKQLLRSTMDSKKLQYNYLRVWRWFIREVSVRYCCSILKRTNSPDFAAPSLPETYSNQINGLHIGPNMGSCGIVSCLLPAKWLAGDIETDEKWANS